MRWIDLTVIQTGGGASAVGGLLLMQVKCATTESHGLSGTSAVDDVLLSAGDLVLVWQQSTATQNGVYSVASGAWRKLGQPLIVAVRSGDSYGTLFFQLTDANTYQANGAVFRE